MGEDEQTDETDETDETEGPEGRTVMDLAAEAEGGDQSDEGGDSDVED